jgi:hypothetical protein
MGAIGFVVISELPPLNGVRGLVPPGASLTLCPVMNFPEIVRLSAVEDGDVSPDFVEEVGRHLQVLPRTLIEIREVFGAGFLEQAELYRIPLVATFIRARRNSQS